VQRLRARASAILTGIGTVLADDPSLTVREPGLDLRGRQLLRVVFDTGLRIPATAKLVADGAPTLVFGRADSIEQHGDALRAAGVTLESLASTGAHLDLPAALARLGQLECNEVLVEAGAELSGAFLDARLVDELVLYVAPTLLGDAARPLARLPIIEQMNERQDFRWVDVRQVGADLRLTLRPIMEARGN
jgi:diaminohydroxyphosphoribosylaminopyrimidine deaminase/5-amino-6-(5-phosphoribosylamino)uracil reductase